MNLFKKSLLNSIQLTLYVSVFVINAQKYSNMPDSLVVKSTEQIIDALKNSNLQDEALYKEALFSKKLTNEEVIKTFIDISKFHYNNEEYERCRSFLDQAKIISKRIKNKEQLCSLYLKSGNSYLKEWNNQKALDEYYKALEIAQEKKNLELEIIARSSISIIRRRMNQLEKALEVSENALKLISKTSYNGKSNHVNLLTIVSDICLKLKRIESAKHYVDEGLIISKLIDYKKGLIDLYIKKGIICQHKQNYEKAELFLDSANIILNTNNLQNALFKRNIDYYLANGFYNKGRYQEAIEKLEGIINSASEDELTKDRVVESHRLLANTYEKLGDEKQAVYWLKKHVKLNERAQQEKDSTINEIYEKDTKILDDSISTLKEYANYIKGSLLFIFLILILVLIRSYRRKKSNKIIFDDLITKITKLESQEIMPQKTSTSNKEIIINDKKIEEVLVRLNKLEEQEYFLNLDCNLRTIAKKAKTNSTYLSKIINSEKGKNFNDYINDLRIDYVLKRLKSDNKFRLFSIKSIATEIGYKSDYSFAKHFKIKTGLNPSYYIKQLEALNDKD